MSKNVLIVDDNSAIRKGLRTLLASDLDIQVCGEASNGREAIERAGELHPDVIVLDVSMPVLNGLQAAPVLHRMLPTACIILFTSYGSVVPARGVAAGVDAVISKDDGITSLLDAIHTLAFERQKPSASDPNFN